MSHDSTSEQLMSGHFRTNMNSGTDASSTLRDLLNVNIIISLITNIHFTGMINCD